MFPPRRARRSSRRFHPDTREWFAVVEGEVRVEIEGQEPFTATRGSLVNIPRQTIYSVETIGAAPSLRFTLNVSGAKTVYPRDVEPPPHCRGNRVDGSAHQSNARPIRRVQSAAPEHSRRRGEGREVFGRPIRARRQVGDARDLRPREEHAAARSGGQGPLPRRERGDVAGVLGKDSLLVRGTGTRSSPAKAMSSTCRRTRGTPRASSATTPAACRSPNTSATPCCCRRSSWCLAPEPVLS